MGLFDIFNNNELKERIYLCGLRCMKKERNNMFVPIFMIIFLLVTIAIVI